MKPAAACESLVSPTATETSGTRLTRFLRPKTQIREPQGHSSKPPSPGLPEHGPKLKKLQKRGRLCGHKLAQALGTEVRWHSRPGRAVVLAMSKNS